MWQWDGVPPKKNIEAHYWRASTNVLARPLLFAFFVARHTPAIPIYPPRALDENEKQSGGSFDLRPLQLKSSEAEF